MPADTAAPQAVLVATKLHAPAVREIVDRPSLVEALASGPQRLKLLRAPAGWGKSTLAAAWSRSAGERRSFAWLSLDSGEDEPRRFWTYVIEALRRLDPSIGSSSLPLLNAPGTEVQAQVLPALINEVDEMDDPAVLVLDDYHLISRPEIHAQLTYLVEHLTEALQVLVVTRVEPPLPLARLRARRDLLELDIERLRFDPSEAEALLNGLLGLDLTDEHVAKLNERTEGWAAGLFLAALSVRGAGDAATFVERFAGDDRNVVDYLGMEVLGAQPPHVREFLLRTSILERLCAPLVEEVAGVEDGAGMLRAIERADLFLISLDSRREWYRYHHLFAELLRLELTVSEPALVPELHRRAARWHLEAGLVPAAIEHTIAARDTEVAGELIAEHWAPTLLQAAGDRIVDSWLRALGDEAVAADVRLCFARCFIGLSYGDMETVARWLAIAERAPLPGPFKDGISSVEGALACVRTAYLWEIGDAGGSLAEGQAVLEQEPEGAPWRAIGAATIGLAHGAVGNWAEGRKWVLEYARIGRAFEQHLNECSGLGSASMFAAEMGDWEAAEQLARRSLEISARHGIDEHWSSSGGRTGLGLVHEHAGDINAARRDLARAVELNLRGAGPITTGAALLYLARVELLAGDRPAAEASLEEAAKQIAAAPDPGMLPERLDEARRRVLGAARAPAAGEPLTERELDVLRLLATPLSQREIGEQLFVSVNTVKTHSKGIYRKLEASGRSQAVAHARERGLI